MGTFEKGILGGFSGKVGNVVGVRWRGRNIMRSLPTGGTSNPSLTQQEQRKKFSLVIKFLTPIQAVVGKYFGKEQGDKSAFNLAVGYHLKEAVTLVGQNFVMDYPKVMISRGDLRGLQDPVITPGAGQALYLTWTDNSGQGMAAPTDQLVLVVYCPDLDLPEMYIEVAPRSAENYNANLPAYLSGLQVEAWGTFVTDTGKLAAQSTYLGSALII